MDSPSPNNNPLTESHTVHYLHSAMVVAGIALGLLVFFSDSHPKTARIVPLLVFSAGSTSLYAGLLALLDLHAEQYQGTRSRWRLCAEMTPRGTIFWAIVFLVIAYILIQVPGIGDAIASWFGSNAAADSQP
jgi:hypothetical protein